MSRLEKEHGGLATLDRRRLLAAAPFALLSACQAKNSMGRSAKPQIDVAALDADVKRVAADARPGVLGVGLMKLQSGESYFLNPD
eukprot:gene65882-90144_t